MDQWSQYQAGSERVAGKVLDRWAALGDHGRVRLVQFLTGVQNMALNNAILHTPSRKLLHRAYKGAVIYGFEFLVRLPKFADREAGMDDVCEGLLWTQARGIIAREFILKIPSTSLQSNFTYHPHNSHLKVLIEYKRRMMAILVVQHCQHSYDFREFENGWTFVHRAAAFGDPELMTALCKRGDLVDLEIPDRINENSPMHIAAGKRNHGSLTALIQANVDVNARDRNGRTPLHHAIATGKKQYQAVHVTRLILAAGADINALDTNNNTPLDLVKANTPLRMELLLFLKVNGGLPGNTLQEGEMRGASLIPPMARLPRSGTTSVTTVSPINSFPPSPMDRSIHGSAHDFAGDWFHASKNGQTVQIMEMLTAGADVNASFPDGTFPLLWAVINGQERIVSALLSRGANINRSDSNNRWTSLHFAAKSGDVKLVNGLLTMGAQIDIRDINGDTPLHVARNFNEEHLGSHTRVIEALEKASDYLLTLDFLS